MTGKIRTLIVEDDIITIKILSILLGKYSLEIEIVGIAKNSEEFINLLISNEPDLILLDINLVEEKNTLEILKEVKEVKSEIIIISSNESYAIEAINQHSISGYILKPIKTIELKNAISTALNNIDKKKEIDRHNSRLSEKLIAITSLNTIELISIKDILYLEADGKYTVFHLNNSIKKVVSKNIGEYEKLLPTNIFFRVHHKYIVNLQKVITINKSDGNYCQLVNGKSLTIAKRRQESLRKFLHI